MERKTVNVNEILDLANNILRNSTGTQDFRWGVITMIEVVLQTSGNYRGFMYLTRGEVPKGEKPGVIYGDITELNQFPDETRRQYA